MSKAACSGEFWARGDELGLAGRKDDPERMDKIVHFSLLTDFLV